jgi:hypothetical protein
MGGKCAMPTAPSRSAALSVSHLQVANGILSRSRLRLFNHFNPMRENTPARAHILVFGAVLTVIPATLGRVQTSTM